MSKNEEKKMETLYRLADGKAEAMEFRVSDKAKCRGIPIKNLKLKPNVLVAAVIRGGKNILPDGNTEIHSGDHAVIVTEAGWLKDIDGIMAGVQ